MRIAFYNIFGELKNAEQETLMRLQYVFSKQGHELLVIDRDGYVISDCDCKGSLVEHARVDFMFTYNTLDFALATLPDVFSVFFHWSPLGFVANFQSILSMRMFNMYDYFACFYEQNVFKDIANIETQRISPIGSSVPADFCVAPKLQKNRKLFYVGVNFERALQNMRYGTLLKELDRSKQLEIYGPKEVYGRPNLWAGFKSYCGEIPFDGKSILECINKAGVCLALNSPMHNDADAVSNRTFEAAAAGAVIISDENAFVKENFGDSVFYIERNLSEEEASKKILSILEWINKHPEEAYEMASRAQKIFLEKLSLDTMVSDLIDSAEQAIVNIKDVSKQTDVIDVICFLDHIDDYALISSQLHKQYYQNLHLIIVAPDELYNKLEIETEHDYVRRIDEYKGRAFVEAKKLLRGKYFMFMDKHSVLHARHIYKNHDVISKRSELFAYSGCYMKTSNKNGKTYVVLNNKPILRDEFLLFSNVSNENVDWHYRDLQCYFIETIFSRSAAIFSREILEWCDDIELSMISEAIHYYLACCSLIKANRLGRFTYTLTTGYSANSTDELNDKVFGYSRRHWYSNGRSAKTYIKEMNECFFKYTFESNPANVPYRNFAGEITWYNEIVTPPVCQNAPMSRKRKIVRALKKMVPKRLKAFLVKCIYA